MLPLELTGQLTFWDGSTAPFSARITPELDHDGCRIYRADLGMFVDAAGCPLLLSSFTLDVLPAHATVRLAFDPEQEVVTLR